MSPRPAILCYSLINLKSVRRRWGREGDKREEDRENKIERDETDRETKREKREVTREENNKKENIERISPIPQFTYERKQQRR